MIKHENISRKSENEEHEGYDSDDIQGNYDEWLANNLDFSDEESEGDDHLIKNASQYCSYKPPPRRTTKDGRNIGLEFNFDNVRNYAPEMSNTIAYRSTKGGQ